MLNYRQERVTATLPQAKVDTLIDLLRNVLTNLTAASELLGVPVLFADKLHLEYRTLPAPATPPPAAPPDACADTTCNSRSCGYFYGILTCDNLLAIGCNCSTC